jgi:AraC family transcriptional regulator
VLCCQKLNRDIVQLQGQIIGTRKLTNFKLISCGYSSNQVLPPHTHAHAYVSVAVQGGYVEECERTAWDCVLGGTIFHVAGENHSNRFSDLGARLLIMEIGAPLLATLRSQGLEPDRQNAVVSPFCMHLALRLEQAVGLNDPLSALSAEGLGMELLAETLHIARQSDIRPDWLASIKEMLHDRFRESLTLPDLAAQVQVHPVYLARAFRKRYGCSVGEMIRALRAEAAYYDLVHSTTPIAEIAVRTGFTDQSHLSRVLKRHAGVSPGQVRKSHR